MYLFFMQDVRPVPQLGVGRCRAHPVGCASPKRGCARGVGTPICRNRHPNLQENPRASPLAASRGSISSAALKQRGIVLCRRLKRLSDVELSPSACCREGPVLKPGCFVLSRWVFLGVEEEKTLLARVRAFVLGKEGPNLAVPAGKEKRSVCCSALCSSGVCPRLSLV